MAHSEHYPEQEYRTSVSPGYERREPVREEMKTPAKLVTGASTMAALAGAGAVVLAILGLLGVLPVQLLAIATIVAGGALLVEGLGIATALARLNRFLDGGRYEKAAGGGVTVEALGGATGVVLGVLALLNIEPLVLLPIAALVFGATFLLGAGAAQEVDQVVSQEMGGGVAIGSSGARALVGIGAGVLGILVLAGVGDAPIVMTLVAMLAVGAGEFLIGATFGARMGKAAT